MEKRLSYPRSPKILTHGVALLSTSIPFGSGHLRRLPRNTKSRGSIARMRAPTLSAGISSATRVLGFTSHSHPAVRWWIAELPRFQYPRLLFHPPEVSLSQVASCCCCFSPSPHQSFGEASTIRWPARQIGVSSFICFWLLQAKSSTFPAVHYPQGPCFAHSHL